MNRDLTSRAVTRVLVMLEYGPGDPDSGEVFDITHLVKELREARDIYQASIDLRVRCTKTYSREENAPRSELSLSWQCDAGEWGPSCAHLTDAINCGMGDGPHVERIKKAAQRLRKRAEKLDQDAAYAKLEQVAAIRAQHPIARVTATPLAGVQTPALES